MHVAIVKPESWGGHLWCLLVAEGCWREEPHAAVSSGGQDTHDFDFVAN